MDRSLSLITMQFARATLSLSLSLIPRVHLNFNVNGVRNAWPRQPAFCQNLFIFSIRYSATHLIPNLWAAQSSLSISANWRCDWRARARVRWWDSTLIFMFLSSRCSVRLCALRWLALHLPCSSVYAGSSFAVSFFLSRGALCTCAPECGCKKENAHAKRPYVHLCVCLKRQHYIMMRARHSHCMLTAALHTRMAHVNLVVLGSVYRHTHSCVHLQMALATAFANQTKMCSFFASSATF